jgi:hypothetical protein
MNLQEYITSNYSNKSTWFEDEVNKAEHTTRIRKVINNKNYLKRIHKILSKPDITWKKQTYTTRKTIYNMLKDVANYHTTYTVGKPISLVGSDTNIKALSDVYKNGGYEKIDYLILNKVLKFADCGEFVWKENNVIKSHIILPECFYPIYDDESNYIGCIESWINSTSNISYFVVYYPDKVERWNNEGGDLRLTETKMNITDLPIHHHNMCDWDELYGESMLDDIIGIVDDFEEFINRLNDAVYTLSTNPIGVMSGAELAEDSAPVDGVGYTISLRNGGTFEFAGATMDSETIKIYLDTLLRKMNEACKMPSVIQGQTNIANISETVIKIIYEATDKFSKENQLWLKEGILKRLSIIKKLLVNQNVQLDNTFVDVSFNVDRPINESELIENLIKCVGGSKEKGIQLLSVKTAREKLPFLGIDVQSEAQEIEKEVKNRTKKVEDVKV